MKRYCPDCGNLMILKDVLNGYDASTGKPYYMVEGKCPNNRWWKSKCYSRIYQKEAESKFNKGEWGTKMI